MYTVTKTVAVVFLLAIICLSAGCDIFKSEEEPAPDPMLQIQEHAETFIEEGRQRGFDVASAVSAIQFETAETIAYEGRTLCGFAPWYDDPETSVRTITIAINETCWTSRPEEDNEALVFHELGHMILDRFHRDDLLPNNRRSSIMVSTNLAGLYAGNAQNRRDYYLDELFDPDTPAPDWSLVD